MFDNPAGSGSLQLVALRQVIDRLEAVVSWLPDVALQQEATGSQLHLASRVLPPLIHTWSSSMDRGQ